VKSGTYRSAENEFIAIDDVNSAETLASFDPVLNSEEFAFLDEIQKLCEIFWQDWTTIGHKLIGKP
jgi:hypothetical protein